MQGVKESIYVRFHFISVYYIFEEILKLIDEVKNSLERTLIFAYYRRYRLSSKVVLSLHQEKVRRIKVEV